MQLNQNQLARQQEIMKARGYFDGTCDGKWGPDSIDAMKLWQSDLKNFLPARPTNGLPLPDVRGPYPAGITLDRATGLLECPILAAAVLQAKTEHTKKKKGEDATPES